MDESTPLVYESSVDDDKPLTELDSVPGDIVENANGDRYLALPNGMLAFIGNKDSRVEGLIEKCSRGVKILRRVQLPNYREPHKVPTFEDDWDAIRGIHRFKAPLPKGCTCTHDALEVVLNCSVHKVKAEVVINGGGATPFNSTAVDVSELYSIFTIPMDTINPDRFTDPSEDDIDEF